MKTLNQKIMTGWIFLLVFILAQAAHAYEMPTFPSDPTNEPLDSWSFNDPTGWTSDNGYAPISFTNIGFSNLGDFQSLVVDTNVPAWLQYPVFNSDGTTNLTIQSGTVLFWFAPDWSSADDTNGGSGPEEYGRLFEVGGFTTNSSCGWWSIYVDSLGENLHFGTQTNDGLGDTYVLSAPIDWTTNYFHFIALTYSPTNVTLYMDGVLATNDPGGLNIWPGTDVLSNGFWMGSDSNGIYQAHGLFNDVATFNYPLDSNDIEAFYQYEEGAYVLNPLDALYAAPLITAATNSAPSFYPGYDVITGQGMLQPVGAAGSCYNGTNSYNVWLTNVTASVANNDTVTFTIEGGSNGVPFDVYVNSVLNFSTNTADAWAWEGQGYQCNTYTITNLSSGTCFVILGTPQDTSGFGLTDAYELLVAKVNPDGPQTDNYDVPYAWYALNGLSMSSATQDPDQDGITNYQEYEYGTRPTVSEGFGIWVSDPNGTTSIP